MRLRALLLTVSTVATVRQSPAAVLKPAAKKPDADETHFGSWRRKIDSGDDHRVLRLEYTSGRDEFEPDEYRAFTDFHRKLVGAIEQPVVIE